VHEPIYYQAIKIFNLLFLSYFLYSFGGGSEMMRDGDIARVSHLVEGLQKYDCQISGYHPLAD